jgi:hypothetical protein
MKHKKLLWVGGGLLGTVLVILALMVFYFPHWLQHKLENETAAESKGIYSLHIKKLKASVFNGTLAIDGLTIKPNFKAWQKLDQNKAPEAGSMLSSFSAEKIRVTHINYLGIIFKKPLQLDSVLIIAPRVNLTKMRADSSATKPFYKTLVGPLKKMHVNNIQVRKADFSYKNNFRNKYNTASLKNLGLVIQNLQLDSAALYDKNRIFYAEEILATVGETDVVLPGQGHRLKMGVVSAGTKKREIKMKAIRLVPLYNTRDLANHQKKSTFWLNLSLPDVLFRNVDFSVYSRSGLMAIDSLLIEKPVLEAFGNGIKLPDSTSKTSSVPEAGNAKPLFRRLGAPLLKMRIKNISVNNAKVNYKDNFRDDFNTIELNSLNLQVKDLLLDSASFYDPKRTFYAASILANTAQTDFLLEDGHYRLKTGAVAINSQAGNVKIGNVKMVPMFSPKELSQRKKRSSVWMNMDIPEVSFEGIDFPGYSRAGNITINSILLNQPRLNAFNDKKHFIQGGDKLFPQDVIRNLKMSLNIGKAEVRDMYIRYDEFDEKALRPGYIILHKFNASVRNISNDKSKMSARNPAISQVSFKFKGDGNLKRSATMKITTRLNLLDPQCRHFMDGTFQNCNLPVFNSIMEPSKSISISSGKVQNGKFRMALTRNSAAGEMQLLYNDFKIKLLDADAKGQSMGSKITSFLANAMVVKSENPEAGQPIRTVAVTVTRRQSQSFVSYWRQCLATGIMASVGIEKTK